MKHRALIVCLLVCCVVVFVSPVQAHANLSRSNPPANGVLASSPEEIRLWFTEPLEPEFSSITIRDSNGEELPLPAVTISPDAPLEMALKPDNLSDGTYTLSWKVVSTADGHATHGSFPFAVGEAVDISLTQNEATEILTPQDSLIRTLNLLAFALSNGSIGFVVFVWRPARSEGVAHAESRLRRLMGFGWVLLGGVSILVLFLQVAITADIDLMEVLGHSALGIVLSSTRFGSLWGIRMLLWLVMGGLLLKRFDRLALLTGAGILLTQSLFSHASATYYLLSAVVGDWLHLIAAVLWLGGLIQFINVLVRYGNNLIKPPSFPA